MRSLKIFLTQLGAPPPGGIDIEMLNCECLGEIGITQLDRQQGFWPHMEGFEQIYPSMSSPNSKGRQLRRMHNRKRPFVIARRRLFRRCFSSSFMRSDMPTASALQNCEIIERDLIFDRRRTDRFSVNVFETNNLQLFRRLVFGLG
jgi:hypothetical protein